MGLKEWIEDREDMDMEYIRYKSYFVTIRFFCNNRQTSNIFHFNELIFILKDQIKSSLLYLYCHGKNLDQETPQPQKIKY